MLPKTFQAIIKNAVEQGQEARRAVERATDYQTRYLARRRYARVQILPGFPITAPFAGLADARAYLDQPELTCLVCGKAYRSLATHLHSSHGIEPDDYRAAYGIPWSAGLAGTTTSAMKSEALKTRLADPKFAALWFADAEHHREKAHENACRQRTYPFREQLARQHLERAGIVIGRWQESDFLRILEIMRERDLILRDVAGKFEGVPPFPTAFDWFNSTPARRRKLVATIHRLSIRNQARSRTYSPQLMRRIRLLRRRGWLQREIAKEMGLSVMTVAKLLAAA